MAERGRKTRMLTPVENKTNLPVWHTPWIEPRRTDTTGDKSFTETGGLSSRVLVAESGNDGTDGEDRHPGWYGQGLS